MSSQSTDLSPGVVQVTAVRTRRDFDDFVRLPWDVPTDREIVRPMLEFQRHLFDRGKRFRGSLSPTAILDGILLGKENPFYGHGDLELFLARSGGKPVARVAAIQNRSHNDYHHDSIGFFGFYDSVADGELGRQATVALFEAAGRWLRERGLTSIRGPFNPTINDDCGIWTEGDEYPSFLMPSGPRYYPGLVEAAGFAPVKVMRVYRRSFSTLSDTERDKRERMAQRLERSFKIHMRAANFKDLDTEVKTFLEIYNATLSNNWGFAPMSFGELRSMAELFQFMLTPDLIRAAEVEENGVRRVVGAAIAVPDINEILRHTDGALVVPSSILPLIRLKRGKPTKRVRIVFLGVMKEYQHTPVSVALLWDVVRAARKFGAEEIEASWVLEDNEPMYRPLEAHDFRLSDKYVIYERSI